MQPFINKYLLIALIVLPMACEGQNKYGLSDEEYRFFLEGYRMRKREPEKAIMIFDSLLRTHPKLCPVIGLKGVTYYLKGDMDSAKKTLRQGIACDSSKGFSYYQLKTIYMELEEYDSAELILLQYMNFKGNDSDNFQSEYSDLGRITRAKNQYHKSVEYLSEAINRCYDGYKYKSCGDLYYLRADSYSIIGEPEKAWEDILIHEQLNPEDRATLVLKGEILQLLGKYSESNKILKEYLTNPTNLGENWVNFMIGVNYHYLNEKEQSCFHLKEAAQLGYEDEMLDELLGNCY